MFSNFNGTRKELLLAICKSANAEQIGVSSVILNLDKITQEKFNVSKDDFIRIYSEDVYASIIAGVCDDKPRFYIENISYIESRNRYIKDIWDKTCFILKRDEDDCELLNLIESRRFKSWEELETYIIDK